MVAASHDNIAWLRDKRPDLPEVPVSQADATTIQLPDEPLAIVSEGYLGPNMTTTVPVKDIPKLTRDLGKLYADSLRNWADQIESGTEVTLTMPVWRDKTGHWHTLEILDRISDLGYTLRSFAHADARKLIYRRPNQVVGRQLLIVRKQ
jgi:hypothetical protein